uniref:Uncharacterized protein n=1 Tax=Nelumbo nucifera TaxID=4432 RepID=A0A822Z717_NELNU|nr:TPA_asm: hypothetical protein HUJ06_000404 [Nelumbo nucifera]
MLWSPVLLPGELFLLKTEQNKHLFLLKTKEEEEEEEEVKNEPSELSLSLPMAAGALLVAVDGGRVKGVRVLCTRECTGHLNPPIRFDHVNHPNINGQTRVNLDSTVQSNMNQSQHDPLVASKARKPHIARFLSDFPLELSSFHRTLSTHRTLPPSMARKALAIDAIDGDKESSDSLSDILFSSSLLTSSSGGRFLLPFFFFLQVFILFYFQQKQPI